MNYLEVVVLLVGQLLRKLHLLLLAFPRLFDGLHGNLLLWRVSQCLDSLIVQFEAVTDTRIEESLWFRGAVDVGRLGTLHVARSIANVGSDHCVDRTVGDGFGDLKI